MLKYNQSKGQQHKTKSRAQSPRKEVDGVNYLTILLRVAIEGTALIFLVKIILDGLTKEIERHDHNNGDK